MSNLEKQLEASVRINALSVVPRDEHELAPLRFTAEQRSMIRDTYANGASPEEFAFLMEVAAVRRLNPLLRQVHFVRRWDKSKNRYVWAVQVSIDGLRAIAERTGKYNGQDEPEYGAKNQHGFPEFAKVRVYRKGWDRPVVGVAYWAEYVQTGDGGKPTRFWADMPFNQIAKCAEAQALRKAFPEDLGGLYTDVEMEQAENDRSRVEVIEVRQNEPDPRRRPITAHGSDDDPGETTNPDPAIYSALLERMNTIENSIAGCRNIGEALVLRAMLGTRAKQSPLAREIQQARESGSITPSMHAMLGKAWMRCSRQVEKLEKQYEPADVLASFIDPDEPENDEP